MRAAWFSFWHVLWSGEWVANVGLPMLVSLVALLIAYRFFRAQLAHDRTLATDQADRERLAAAEQAKRDRELMQEQIAAAREDTERQRRREAMRTLANHLFSCALARNRSSSGQPIDESSLKDLLVRTELIAGFQPILNQVFLVAKECNMRAGITEGWKRDRSEAVEEARVDLAEARFLLSHLESLRILGEACLAWDGDLILHELSFVATPTKEQLDPWRADHEPYVQSLTAEWDDTLSPSQ